MYNNLSFVLRDKLIQDLRNLLGTHPIYSKELIIQDRYGWELRPKYAVVVNGSSAELIQFSPDNWIGNLRGHCSLAKVSNRPNTSITWVTEDSQNLYEEHYNEDVTSTLSDLVVQVTNYPLRRPSKDDVSRNFKGIVVFIGNERVEPQWVDYKTGKICLPYEPSGNPVTVSYSHRKLAAPGFYYFETVSANQFRVTPLLTNDGVLLGRGTEVIFYLPDSTVDAPEIRVNGTPVPTDCYEYCEFLKRVTWVKRPPDGNVEVFVNASPIAWSYLKSDVITISTLPFFTDRAAKLPITPLWVTFIDEVPMYRLVGDRIYFNSSVDPASKLLLMYKEDVTSPITTADIFDPYTKFTLNAPIHANSLRVMVGDRILDSSEYTANYSTGSLTLSTLPSSGDQVSVSYCTVGSPSPVYDVDNFMTNNTAIPGVILYFGLGFQDGDKQVVLVTEEREPIARVYGGKWRVTLTLDINAMDTLLLDNLMADVTGVLWTDLKERWDNEGLTIERVVPGGESEEEYDPINGLVSYKSSVQLTVLTDWELRKPIPLINRQISLSNRIIHRDGSVLWYENLNKGDEFLPFSEKTNSERWFD